VNLDQLVVRLPLNRVGGMPTPDLVSIRSQRGAPRYFATSVSPVAGDPQAFVFLLNRALGGDGTADDGNGDRLTLTITGAGALGTSLVVPLDVLQGDVDASGSVLADDFSAVKKKFFRSAGGAADGDDPAVNYSPFHDVDGSGAILANDFTEVKKRFFQTLPVEPTPVAPASVTVATTRARPVTRELFSSTGLLV
jgi:hypothetical protein